MRPGFTFRPLTRADLPLLHEWLNRPHVAEWWQGDSSFEHVERTHGADLDSDVIWQFFACLGGVPVGYVQRYRVMGADPDWWQDETDPGARGVDQFLANAEQLGRGLGSQMVRQFVAELFADAQVSSVQTDPAPSNARAIRAYEKAGFQRERELETPDGPALLMRITRQEWLRDAAKREAYQAVRERLSSLLADEDDLIAAQATIACELHQSFDTFDWTGFYRTREPELLVIGPYQGTHGCLRIPFSRGVCGAAARTRQTQRVPDVSKFEGHIACSGSTQSEIVVPIVTAAGKVLGVLDVDSNTLDAFSELDRAELEAICADLALRFPNG